ncbi:MAG TPA: mechanosensitive ion channel protein MscS [Rhodobacteraceae bacterium]|nr:mechanosensitive ion channel protein MscS [Paracoccaceae bacterium]
MTFRAASLLAPLMGLLLLVLPAAAQDRHVTAFPLDHLNRGLDTPPPALDRATPRATIESLLHLADREDWEAAAHLLDLGNLPVADQARRGPDLARKLHTVINRKAVISWDDLPDRPDALVSGSPRLDATAGEARKSILLWQLELNDHPASIRLNRVIPDGGEPVWVISRQTVDMIAPLYARYGPPEFERNLPEVLLRDAAFDLMIWELAAIPATLALAVLAGYLARWVLDAMARRVRGRLLTDVLRAMRGPAIFGAVVAVAVCANQYVFVFSGTIDAILGPLICIGMLGAILWLVVNAIDAVLDRIISFGDTDLSDRRQHQNRRIATRIAALRHALIVGMVLLGIALFVASTNIFDNIGLSILGTAGALTLILGFAARRVLGNIMSSLQIALNQSAKIGDRIVYKGHLCHVERINFTYVQLRDWDNTRIVVPVEEFATTDFENWTMKEPEMLRIIKLKLAHDVDVGPLREAFDAVLHEIDQEELDDLSQSAVWVAGQDVFGTDVWFAVPCIDPNTSWEMACQARERLLRRITEIGEETDRQMFPEANPAEAA